MTLDDSIQGFRLRVRQDAERCSNVSATCRRYAVSRTVFYRWRARLARYGPDGSIRRGGRPDGGVRPSSAWPTSGA